MFIDRDGTIGGGNDVVCPGVFKLYPNVRFSINQLKESGYTLFSFTNQPGISKGETTRKAFEEELLNYGFDFVYICSHHPDDRCSCRKPSIGMLSEAAKAHHLDLSRCVVIGDRWTDMLAAEQAGCRKILVKTGAGLEAYRKYENQEYFGKWAEVHLDFVASNFNKAVEWILNKEVKNVITR